MKIIPLVLSALLLAGCGDPPAPAMSMTEARAQLLRVGGAGSTQAFCSEDGRRAFRDAARAFTLAVEREQPESELPFFSGGDDPGWSLILLGVSAKILKPNDLQGPARQIAALLSLPLPAMGPIANTRDAMARACPELISVYRAYADLAKTSARLSRAEERGESSERMRTLQERYGRQSDRIVTAIRRFEAKMRAEGWEPSDRS